MRLGIDASNLRAGGGVTHLVELLRAAHPNVYNFDQVVVWASQATLTLLEERPWLVKRTDSVLESHYLRRALWQRNRLGELAKAERCDLLFIPGGSFATDFRPVVTMSRNLLPFEWRELMRYGRSIFSLKLALLRWSQSRSFRRANGTIFLTQYAQDAVLKVTGALPGQTAIISHGVDRRFFQPPRMQRSLAEGSNARPFRLIYISIIDTYKHQWQVAEAVAKLQAEGLPVVLDLIGPAYPPALVRLRKTLDQVDPAGEFVRYLGGTPHAELHIRYAQADVCVFASSCENMPNILLEGMASGLPIACSNRGPMPEILGEAGAYFDPEHSDEIAAALRTFLNDPELRARCAEGAYMKAQTHSWDRCAHETFGFLRRIAWDYNNGERLKTKG
ncbi:MAG: glycosyltransferase family 1 protein [Candidatus Competibacteraceae bacterium]